MARRDTYIQLLKSVPLFSRLSKKDLNEVARLTTDLFFTEGDQLIVEGDARTSSMLIILEGEAVVRKKGRKIATLKPGDFAGELAVLTGAPRNASVIAAGDVRALVLDRREIMSLIDNVPRITKNLLLAVVDRLATVDTKSVQ